MRTRILIIITGVIMAITALSAFDDETNNAYGIWFSKSPEELLEQSETVFVGTVTSVDVANIEHQRNVGREKNGVYEQFTETITITLDEYTVHVEEYLKNPQGTPIMTVLEATVGGVPSGPARIGGFETGDRVLFYVPKIDGQNQYSPESFKIPEQCDTGSILVEPRIQMGNAFTILQDNMPRADNFTAGKPMKFVYGKDMRTLDENKTFDVHIGISKAIDKSNEETVFQKDIYAEAKPCQWVTSAEWEFTPKKEGNYRMYLNIKKDGKTYSTSDTGFSVKPEIATSNRFTPLGQFKSGIPLDEIKCKDGLVMIQKHDGTPACVKPETKVKMVERGWTDSVALVTNKEDCSIGMREHALSQTLSEKYAQRLVLFMQPDSAANICVLYKSSLDNSGSHALNAKLYTGRTTLEDYIGSDISVNVEPKVAPMELGSRTIVKYSVEATSKADGVYWIGIEQLGQLPVIVWKDRKSISADEIPVYHGFRSSGNKVLDSVIVGVDGNGSLDYALAKIRR